MDNSEIAQYRLRNQQIAQHNFSKVEALVSWLGAMQAQDYLGAKWSIGLRIPGITDAGVEEALAKRLIVRTWPMRHTLHFVEAKDVKWMLSLYPEERIPKYMMDSGLTQSSINEGEKLIVKAFDGKKQIQRSELHKFMQSNGSTVFKNSFARAHVIRRAAREGIICYGPIQGKQHTFVLLESWTPKAKIISRDKAMAELIKRYFTSHAPATIKDFAWWSGLGATEARQSIESISGFRSENIDENEYWMPAKMAAIKNYDKSAYLLPGFDEYTISYKDRSAFIPKEQLKRIYNNTTLVFSPIIVIAGKAVGTWKRKTENGKISITINPFSTLGRAEKELANAAREDYKKFARSQIFK